MSGRLAYSRLVADAGTRWGFLAFKRDLMEEKPMSRLVILSLAACGALTLAACGATIEQKAASGALAGAVVGGPVGAAVGGAAGTVVGQAQKPN